MKEATVVDLDGKVSDEERAKDVASNGDALKVGYHPALRPCYARISLTELPIPPSSDLRLIPAIHLYDVILINVPNRVDCKEARKHYRKVVPHCQYLATLIGAILDKLGILTILACEGITQIKHRGVDLQSATEFEDPPYDLEVMIMDNHLRWEVTTGAIGNIGLALGSAIQKMGQHGLYGCHGIDGQGKGAFSQYQDCWQDACDEDSNINAPSVLQGPLTLGDLLLGCPILSLLVRPFLQYLLPQTWLPDWKYTYPMSASQEALTSSLLLFSSSTLYVSLATKVALIRALASSVYFRSEAVDERARARDGRSDTLPVGTPPPPVTTLLPIIIS